MSPRLQKRLIWISALVLVLFLCGLAGLYLYLPRYVEARLIPQVAHKFGLDAREVRVRRITFSGTELGPVRLSAGGRSALAVETLRLDYDLGSLIGKQIRGITLEGLRIDLRFGDRGLTVAGVALPPPVQPDQARGQGAPLDLKTLLPLALGRFAIHRAVLDVSWADKQVQIPFDIEADTSALSQGRATAKVSLTPRQSRLNLEIGLDSGKNQWRVDLKNLAADLSRYGDLLPETEKTAIKGTLTASGSALGTLIPPKPGHYSLEATLDDAGINLSRIAITNSTSEKGPMPLRISLRGDGPDSLDWSFAPLDIQAKARIRITALTGRLVLDNQQLTLQAEAVTDLPPQVIPLSADQGLELKTPLTLPWRLESASTPQDGLVFELSTRSRPRENGTGTALNLGLPQATWTASVPEIRIQGKQGREGLSAAYRLGIPQNRFNLPDGASARATLSAEGKLTVKDIISGDLRLNLADGLFRRQARQINIENLTLGLLATQNREGGWQLSGEADLRGARLIDPELQLIAKQVKAGLPFAWPPPAKAEEGRLSVAAIQWKAHRMGNLQGTLRQKDLGVAFDLQHQSKLFKGMRVYLTGEAASRGTAIEVRLPEYAFEKEVDLGQFVPAARDYLVQGQLAAHSRLTFKEGRLGGTARLKIDQGRLRHEKQKLDLSRIRAEIQLEDLARIRSGPGQTLSIGRIQLDRIQADDLAVAFRITSADRLFVEKADLKWCQGTIGVRDVALSTVERDLALTLDCKGVNMAMMLEQLGVAQGSGEVALNGSIPVRWTRGRLVFDKGFLASPPGQTGVIQLRELKGSQQLIEGLPPDTPQRIQMDIAMEALKDYTYESVDLRVGSEADELVLKLQLEGKPNRLLPFAYDKDLGQFKRVQGQGQADFKGIGIDLNLRSPINEIIDYRNLLNPKP